MSKLVFLLFVTSSWVSAQQPNSLTTSQEPGYVDPTLCSGCHYDIYKSYRRTGMGRSFSRPSSENTAGGMPREDAFYHEASNRYYQLYKRDGGYFQRRYQIGPDGTQTNVIEKEIHFVLGSGNHGRTYLHRTRTGALIQLPLGWYAENGGLWGMSPGYDRPDHKGFRRRIDYACVFCHNGYPELEPGSDTAGKDPVFPGRIPEGIDCQRCHGPSHDHIQAVQAGLPLPEVRRKIVNPARLSSERQLDVCLQCHLESTTLPLPAMIRRYERSAFSYRPGQPLSEYILHFERAAETGREDRFEVNHAGYRLLKSACFQESNGRMTCITCHDPHTSAAGDAARRRYTDVCRRCHSVALKKLVDSGAHTDSHDCVGCHMPRRRAEDAVHAVMTDHYIQRRMPNRDLLAPLKEAHESNYRGKVVLYFPSPQPPPPDGELHQAVAQVRHGTNLEAGILQLRRAIERYQPQRAEFYFELAEAYLKSGQLQQSIAIYEQEVLTRNPRYLPAYRSLWLALSKLGRLTEGITALKRALAVAPEDAFTLDQLGLAYLEQGRFKEAGVVLRRALTVDPDLPEARNNLGLALAGQGRLSAALASFRAAIRLEPNFARAHYNLGLHLFRTGKVEEAINSFQESIRCDPGLAIAYANLGVCLASQGRLEDAMATFQKAIQIDPELTVARSNLHTLETELKRLKKPLKPPEHRK